MDVYVGLFFQCKFKYRPNLVTVLTCSNGHTKTYGEAAFCDQCGNPMTKESIQKGFLPDVPSWFVISTEVNERIWCTDSNNSLFKQKLTTEDEEGYHYWASNLGVALHTIDSGFYFLPNAGKELFGPFMRAHEQDQKVLGKYYEEVDIVYAVFKR